MSLDTSTYSLALLRVDGRRWNELRRLNGQIRTQHASDGSSYLEMGHTKVMCVVTGPHEAPRKGGASQSSNAVVNVNIVVAGFSSVDRRRRGRNDKLVNPFFFPFFPYSSCIAQYLPIQSTTRLTPKPLSSPDAPKSSKPPSPTPSQPPCTPTSSPTAR